MEDGVQIGNLVIPVAKGDKGDKGDTGKIVGLSVVMLDSTATPTVVNTGTQYEANYQLGIPRGTGVSSAVINEDGELVFTLTDNTELNLGVIMPNSVASVSMNEDFDFIVTLTDGTETTVGNLADEMQDVMDEALENYYTKSQTYAKSETYTKDETNAQILSLGNTLLPAIGRYINLSIDASTYVLTATLKNNTNTAISTSSIDLPLESMVVSGSYDSANKKVVLTLQNGNTVEFSVADLVAGLQSEITSSNKLDSDLVDDTNQAHKFVSSSEKTTWGAKYDKPSGGIPKTDLASAVQTSLGKADTALQTTDIVSSVDSSSTNSKAVGAKLFYDTIGDINTMLDQMNREVV